MRKSIKTFVRNHPIGCALIASVTINVVMYKTYVPISKVNEALNAALKNGLIQPGPNAPRDASVLQIRRK